MANPPVPASTISALTATDSPATLSGLQDAASAGATSTVTVGHYLAGAGVLASTANGGGQNGGQKALTSTPGTWGQQLSYSAAVVNGDSRTDIFESGSTGVTVGSVKFAQQNNVWMLDTNQGTAYKVSTAAGSAGTVNGVYKTGPGRHPSRGSNCI